MIICDKYNSTKYINNSSCYYSFTPLFLRVLLALKSYPYICCLLNIIKGHLLFTQTSDGRISNFLSTCDGWWLCSAWDVRRDAMPYQLLFISTYLHYSKQPKYGAHSAGHFRITSCLICCHLYVSEKHAIPKHYLIYRCDSRLSRHNVIIDFSCQWLLFCHCHLSKLFISGKWNHWPKDMLTMI